MDIIRIIMRSIIIGAGTYGEVYLAYLQEAGVDVIGFLDDDPKLIGSKRGGIPVLGGVSLLDSLKNTQNVEAVYCPIGNNKLRVKLLSKAKKLGYAIPNFIHSSVNISPKVEIGEGVYILLGTNIMPYTIIKDYVMISMGVNIAHHTCLDVGTFLSTGTNIGASLMVNNYSYIGISSTIMTGVKELGENCLIGAGAVVINDVEENAVMAGIPARVLKYRK